MAEGLILPLAKSVIGDITSFTGELVFSSVAEKIKAAKSAKNDLNDISEKLEAICAVFADAEERQYANKAIKIWLRDLKSVVYNIDDLLDEVATDALQRRVNKGHLCRQLRYYLSCSNPLISRFDLSHKVNNLRVKLENIVAKKADFNLTERPIEISSNEIRNPLDRTPYVYEPTIIGREAAKHDILSKVQAVSDGSTKLAVLPIVGIGGIGKTALAKLVYKDVEVLNFDMKLWACVSDKFQLKKIVEDIVENATGEKNLSSHELGTLIKKLSTLLGGRKYFLVLDDVWEDDVAKWLELKNLLTIGKAGSIILITTRSDHVASITKTVEPYNLDSLPVDVCWSIFKQLAFVEGEEERYKDLVKIGRSIVEKCNGVPLVVTCLGSMLRSERDEQQWQNINDMDSFVGLHGQYEKKVMSLLKLSYDKLPSYLKPCFVHLSLFLKDTTLRSNVMTKYWSALGLLQSAHGETEIESIGYSYFLQLVSRSLLHEPNLEFNNIYLSQCKMHDMMHDLATNILEEELSIVTLDRKKVSPFTRHLIWGYEGSNSLEETLTFPKELCDAPYIRSFRFGYIMEEVSKSFLEEIISKFRYLRILDVGNSQFEELPKTIGNLKHLRYLDLTNNCALKSLPNSTCKLLNLETFHLVGCEKLQKLPDDIYLLQRLRKFNVTTCQVSLGKKFNELSSLRSLAFGKCKRLTSLWDDCNVGSLASLRFLYFLDCPELTSLPKSMKFLTGLESLFIINCEMLDMEKGESSLHGLQSLRQLFIVGVPKLVRLPRGIQSAAASLQDLIIVNCRGLVEFPEWLQWFTSLRRLEIKNCPNVMSLPKEFCHLNTLQLLEISGCPELSKRCAVPTGEDYYLIQHIPTFKLDGVTYTPTPNPPTRSSVLFSTLNNITDLFFYFAFLL